MRDDALKIGAAGWLFVHIAVNLCFGGELLMTPIPNAQGVSPKIIGGTRADPKQWPATLVFTTEDGRHCTGTIVGDRAIITAAHCIAEGVKARALLSNMFVNLSCYHHPDYDDSPKPGGLACHLMVDAPDIAHCTADLALCVPTDPDLTIPSSAGKFERIKGMPPGAVEKKNVTLLGYGCTVLNGPLSETLYVGSPKVRHTSRPGASTNPQNSYQEFIETGGPAVCDGDSGGAAYSNQNAKSREIVGISSRGNLSTLSYLVNVLDQRISRFLTSISTADNINSPKRNIKICGLDATALNCVF